MKFNLHIEVNVDGVKGTDAEQAKFREALQQALGNEIKNGAQRVLEQLGGGKLQCVFNKFYLQ